MMTCGANTVEVQSFSRTMIQSMIATEVITANATRPGAASLRIRRVSEAAGVRSCANDQRLSSQATTLQKPNATIMRIARAGAFR